MFLSKHPLLNYYSITVFEMPASNNDLLRPNKITNNNINTPVTIKIHSIANVSANGPNMSIPIGH